MEKSQIETPQESTPRSVESVRAQVEQLLMAAKLNSIAKANHKKTQIKIQQEPISCDDENFHLAIPLGNGVTLEMIKVKAGTFMMGSPEDELERGHDETLHKETLTQDYWLGKFPVTQAQFEAVVDYNPSYRKGDNRPVEGLNRDDIREFCDELNEKYADKLPKGYVFDLPSEAQWEYACRAGSTTVYCWGDSCNGNEANCNGNYPYGMNLKGPYREQTSEVGSYEPNAWGFYDMHGNVWELCKDSRGGEIPDSSTFPIYRGGSWRCAARHCRSADRYECYDPDESFSDLGFRIALVPETRENIVTVLIKVDKTKCNAPIPLSYLMESSALHNLVTVRHQPYCSDVTVTVSTNGENRAKLLALIPLGIFFLLWGVGCIAFYCERVTDMALIIWWTVFCSWNGVYYSLRKKNPESKRKWDLANVIAWVLLMPCSIIGYMIYRGVF